MMKKFALYQVLLVLLLGWLASSCRDDSYYERPKWLEPPIYEQLQKRGNFTQYLICVDKAGFTKNLSTAGYYTVFAPTDEAFATYLALKGLVSADDLDVNTARNIVAYSLVPSVSTKAQLDDLQTFVSTTTQPSSYRNIAFKRETYAYKWVYPYTDFNGVTKDVIDVNAAAGALLSSFSSDGFNKKNIPFFTSDFLSQKNLSASDYNYFFPNKEFTGFNVVDAAVTEADIYAENGIIHIVDKVIEPLKNIEELLADNSDCSDFKSIIEKYVVSSSIKAPEDFLLKYQQGSGVRKDIFIKYYPGLLFSPNCETYYGGRTGIQTDGWTLFAPTNQALQNFFTERFFKAGYKSLDQMPNFVITELLNAHMWNTTVWPSKFATTQNYFGEEARFDPAANVVKANVASNGLFYKVDKVQATNAFNTVLGDILLNPQYTLMYQALVSTENQYLLKNPIAKLKILLLSNAQFASLGLSYNYGTNSWDLNNPNWTGVTAATALDRLMKMLIILDKDVNFSEWGMVKTYGGEYLRYQSNYVWASGNPMVTIRPRVFVTNPTTFNGNSYVFENFDTPATELAITFSTNNIGAFLESNTNYRSFYNYLDKSAKSKVEGGEGELSRLLYNPDTKAITDVLSTDEQTFLIPNNTAIAAAVAAGYLPPITVNDFTQAEQEKVLKFIKFHILKKVVIVPNEGYNGPAVTHYKTNEGDTFINVDSSTSNKLVFTSTYKSGDNTLTSTATATATATSGHTNVLANRAVIHLIDNFLRY